MKSKVSKGKFAEDLACQYLQGKGFVITARNFRSPYGEIDVIFEDQGQLVFVEVKAKFSDRYGTPEEEFDNRKYQKMNLTILEYLSKNQINHDNYRIDLLALQMDEKARICKIKHYKSFY